MSDAVQKQILAEIRLLREEVSEVRADLDLAHQKIDGLSVLLTMLAGSLAETDEDAFVAMMDEIGEDNPQ